MPEFAGAAATKRERRTVLRSARMDAAIARPNTSDKSVLRSMKKSAPLGRQPMARSMVPSLLASVRWRYACCSTGTTLTP